MADENTPSERALIAAYAEKVHASSRASEDEKAGRVLGYGRGLVDGNDLSDEERFCHLCAAGLDSSQHNTECVGSDRGLAAHDREVRAEALRAAADSVFDEGTAVTSPAAVREWLKARADSVEAGSIHG